jgi:hypothetical protein
MANNTRISIEQLINHIEKTYGVSEKSITNTQIKRDVVIATALESANYSVLQPNLSKNIQDFPPKLKKIFDPYQKNIFRYGLHTFDSIKSFISSILFCITNNYEDLDKNNQLIKVNATLEYILKSLHNGQFFDTHQYKNFKLKKEKLREILCSTNIDKSILFYISDLFNINIFLVNINKDQIFCIYPELFYNIYKVNIFISYFDNICEPMILDGERLVSYKNIILKKILHISKDLIQPVSYHPEVKDLQVGYIDLKKYIPDDVQINKVDQDGYDEIDCDNPDENIIDEIEQSEIEIVDKTNGVFVSKKTTNKEQEQEPEPDLEAEKEKPKITTKTKLEVLQNICKSYNISIYENEQNTKLKTRKQLIDDIKSI